MFPLAGAPYPTIRFPWDLIVEVLDAKEKKAATEKTAEPKLEAKKPKADAKEKPKK